MLSKPRALNESSLLEHTGNHGPEYSPHAAPHAARGLLGICMVSATKLITKAFISLGEWRSGHIAQLRQLWISQAHHTTTGVRSDRDSFDSV